MRKIRSIFSITFFLIYLAVFAQAKEDDAGNKDNNVSPGMEALDITGNTLIIPKGLKLKQSGNSLILLEDTDEYMSRRLLAIEDRIDNIEEREGKLQETILNLEKTIDKIMKEKEEAVDKEVIIEEIEQGKETSKKKK